MWGFCSYLEAAGWTFAKKLLSAPPRVCPAGSPSLAQSLLHVYIICVTTDRLETMFEFCYRQTLPYDL